jgi:RNA polymerase sigma factor (sigma-70 family)
MPMPEQPQNDEQFPLDSRVAIMQSEDTTPEDKEQAFRSIYEELQLDMLRYAKSMTRSDEHSADIVQEAFLKIWRNIGTYKATTMPLKAWVVRIVRNQTIDFHRSSYRRIVSAPKENIMYDGPDTLIATDPLSTEEIVEVKDTLDSLKKINNYRMLMQNLMGVSITELSENSGITESGVHGRLHRARRAAQSTITDRMAA